ncbi:hypothetical protein K438DRAFT_2008451 [Mycena galopus ATCC 62051]|nr:hypothetical protein K438DRAFT_2008451 [Mycena galopus ATCC 62051]
MSVQDQDAQKAQITPRTNPALSAGWRTSQSPKAKDIQETQENYRRLKRRFSELEGKQKETSGELQRSEERNVKMRDERNILLGRIIELESQPGFVAPTDNLAELRSRTRDQGIDADAEIDPALLAHDATLHPSNTDANGNNKEKTAPPVMVSSTGTRLRIRPVGGIGHDTSLESPDSGGMLVDDENDSSDYSPPQKPAKRTRVDADYTDTLIAVAPEPKTSRRSSRRAAPAAANPPSTSHSRITQQARSAPALEAAPPQAAPIPDSGSFAPVTNGHTEATLTASSSSTSPATRPSNLAFNPYYGYLTPNPSMPAPYNPYIGAYMPMPYMPPPNFTPPPPQQEQQQTRPAPAAEAPRAAKPKRLKAHTVTSKSYSIPMVPRDKKGKPMLPLNVGIMTVVSLGDVCMREHFHTERYIYPVGYEVTRRYMSTIDQTAEVVYHCTILDGGDGPKFQIIPSDVPDRPVIAGTATGAWSSIVKQANVIRQRQHSNSVSGPDFFGLGQNTIKHLIQELPNADRLRDYVWQHFVEGGPLGGRHAAVIPALPEEYDAAMPIGSYYPPRPQVQREPQDYYPPHIMAEAQTKRAQQAPHHQQQQQEYGGGVTGGSNGDGDGAGYYLSHTQQPSGEVGYAPSPPNGIMNAFSTQEGHENGGREGIES